MEIIWKLIEKNMAASFSFEFYKEIGSLEKGFNNCHYKPILSISCVVTGILDIRENQGLCALLVLQYCG